MPWKHLLLYSIYLFFYISCEEININRSDVKQSQTFTLPIIHINDFHARFVQTSETSGKCLPKTSCIGGLARIVTAVRELKKNAPNAIFLNAADNYQGTIWYNIHKWKVTLYFMNKLGFDATTIGNHEFDDGIAGLVPFLQQSEAPVVVSNIDDNEEPSMHGLYKKSITITRGNFKFGIIGVIAYETKTTSMGTGKLKFLDEVTSVNAEAKKLKNDGVKIIIVLSHSGIDIDRIMAARCADIDVIVGGHSHTFLYTGKPPNKDVPADKYPIVVTQNTNRTVLIVQAAAFTKYLGNLTVSFNDEGEVVNWEGNPILMDSSIKEDLETLKELEPWAKEISKINRKVIGVTQTYLNKSCREGECNLANFITDAMVHSYFQKSDDPKYWTYAAISCFVVKGIRSDIPIGPISHADLMTLLPFEDKYDVVQIKGETLKKLFEESVIRSYSKEKFVGVDLLHWAGVKLVYNISRPAYSRVDNVQIRCQECSEPSYENLREDHWYRVVMQSYVLNGGAHKDILQNNYRNRIPGNLDIDVIADYLKAKSPLNYMTDQRMIITGKWNSNSTFDR